MYLHAGCMLVLHVNEVLSPSSVKHGRGTLVKRECFKPLHHGLGACMCDALPWFIS